MRLEQVEIVGFKSFCDKQELSFQGGVTGIVGPNGCGKSNISDAISWVLGRAERQEPARRRRWRT